MDEPQYTTYKKRVTNNNIQLKKNIYVQQHMDKKKIDEQQHTTEKKH